MLVELCQYVIVGHSERRQHFGETDGTINRKMKAALKAGLQPMMCVGETLRQREEGKTAEVISRQLQGGLEGVDNVAGLMVAYEPVWAIGTGEAATPEIAVEVMGGMILDELGGLDILKELRSARPRLPVIILTAKGEEGDRVEGLTLGADDYVTKPFAFPVLLARLRAVLRRAGVARPGKIVVGDLVSMEDAKFHVATGQNVWPALKSAAAALRYSQPTGGAFMAPVFVWALLLGATRPAPAP